jgi:hypothetical protein
MLPENLHPLQHGEKTSRRFAAATNFCVILFRESVAVAPQRFRKSGDKYAGESAELRCGWQQAETLTSVAAAVRVA